MLVVAVIVASVFLGSPFGDAEARATSTEGGLTFEVFVEVELPAVAVLARVVGPVDELPPVALTQLEEGRWAGIVELPVVENVLMGFEIIPASGPAIVSGVYSLVDYGIDPVVFQGGEPPPTTTTTEAGELFRGSVGWAALALLAAAGFVALALLWFRWGRGDEAERDERSRISGAEDPAERAGDR